MNPEPNPSPPVQLAVADKRGMLDLVEAGVIRDSDAELVGLPTYGAFLMLKKFTAELIGSHGIVPRAVAECANPAGTIIGMILRGREMRLTAMQSLAAFFPSPDGRLGMYAEAMANVMLRHGCKFNANRREDKATGRTVPYCSTCGADICETDELCHWEVIRPDGQTFCSKFSAEDVKRAGLGGQHIKYPRRMKKWRVIGDLFRTAGGDLGGGGLYNEDEMDEIVSNQAQDDQRRVDIMVQRATNPFVAPSRMAEEAAAAPPAAAQEPPPAPPTPKPAPPEDKPPAPPPSAPPPPPADSPAKRGRPPKAAASAATAPHKPEPDQSRSGQVDEPADLGEKIQARLKELTDHLPHQNPTKLSARFADFFRGLLGFDGPLSKQRVSVYGAIPLLESAILKYKSVFEADGSAPTELGERVAECSKLLMAFCRTAMSGWSEEIVSTFILFNARYLDPADDADARDWALDGVKLDQMEPMDAHAFLRANLSSRGAAAQLKTVSINSKQPLHVVVAWVETFSGKAVEEMSAQDFTRAVSALNNDAAVGVMGWHKDATPSSSSLSDESPETDGLFGKGF